MPRELTREEKKSIRALVTRWCANYDREYGCLPLECECFMLMKCWTGPMCRYFRDAVLPIDPALAVQLAQEGPVEELRICPLCGRAFLPKRRQLYCSRAAHLPPVRQGLSPQAAAALLLPGVSGGGEPPQEPGADAQPTPETGVQALRLKAK